MVHKHGLEVHADVHEGRERSVYMAACIRIKHIEGVLATTASLRFWSEFVD